MLEQEVMLEPSERIVAALTQPFFSQPFAWQSREYLRKKLIGREVSFTVEYKVPGTGKEYCYIYNGKGMYCQVFCSIISELLDHVAVLHIATTDTEAENVAESIVAEGLVELRRGGLKPTEYVFNAMCW